METAARMILHDFQRGRLPYFVSPPSSDKDNLNNTNQKNIDFVAEEETKTESLPNVKQNFQSLLIVPEFQGEDLKSEDTEETIDDEVDETSDMEEEEEEFSEEGEDDTINQQPERDVPDNEVKGILKGAETKFIHTENDDDDDIIDSSLLENLTSEEKKFLRIKDNDPGKKYSILIKICYSG